MLSSPPLYNLAPVATLAVLGSALALVPLAWVSWRHHREGAVAWLRALTVLTLFLTFDLVVFGAFTRLTDSGLGCPDWPGCYGSVSPVGAGVEIHAAQAVMPAGPVTVGKAWIEMVHRYLAMTVGALITVLVLTTVLLRVRAWLSRRRSSARGAGGALAVPSPWWPVVTWVWVCLQGAFGALTVTMKLYPAIVTLHLLGGVGLLVLLAVQSEHYRRQPLAVPTAVRRLAWLMLALTIMQVTLGGWVSTNYAVLACADFPLCQGQWWPPMDFYNGMAIQRELGLAPDGAPLPFAALTAIHMVHRLGAALLLCAAVWLVWALWRVRSPSARRWAWVIGAALLWQLGSGLSNVVLGWPLAAALAHTAGAAALMAFLAVLLTRASQNPALLQAPAAP